MPGRKMTNRFTHSGAGMRIDAQPADRAEVVQPNVVRVHAQARGTGAASSCARASSSMPRLYFGWASGSTPHAAGTGAVARRIRGTGYASDNRRERADRAGDRWRESQSVSYGCIHTEARRCVTGKDGGRAQHSDHGIEAQARVDTEPEIRLDEDETHRDVRGLLQLDDGSQPR